MFFVSYEQGVSTTVHIEGRDLVFLRRGKMYGGDMRVWICKIGSPKLRVNVTTVTQNKVHYSETQVARAKKAFHFIKAAENPSAAEAVASFKDGNIINSQ